jgi:DNA-binding transcriptional LysR family regulator
MWNGQDLTLRQLRMLSLLLEFQSLTRVAELLETNQPTTSKMLGRLRRQFNDPLFVRVGQSMHPTPRALALSGPLRELLGASDALMHATPDFDPGTSRREFKVLMSEVGMIQNLPPIIRDLERCGDNLRLRAIPLDSLPFAMKLEIGEADIAIGTFPRASGNIRRQRLYADSYVSVARKDHPRLANLSKVEAFLDERHIVVTASSTGHGVHQKLEKILLSRLEPDRISTRVPSFLTCAYVASRTDAIGSLPAKLADRLARDLKLAVFETPLALPRIDIGQFWHERVNQDAGHRWFRSRIASLFPARSA